MKLRKEFNLMKQAIPGERIPMWYGVAWVEPIWSKAVCYPFGIHLLVRWAKLLYYSLMAPRRTWWEEKLHDARQQGFEAGRDFALANLNVDGKRIFSRSQLRRITAQTNAQARREGYQEALDFISARLEADGKSSKEVRTMLAAKRAEREQLGPVDENEAQAKRAESDKYSETLQDDAS